MAVYTVRIWNNGVLEDNVRGSVGEYDMGTEPGQAAPGDAEYTPDEIRMRLLEALVCNLASIAESLEGLHAEIRTQTMWKAGV